MAKSNGIIDWCIRNHGIVFMITAGLVLLGIFGLWKMNKDEFPQFTIRQGIVAGVYPGATPEEVESQLAKPLEQYLFTFEEVNKEKTYSYSEDGMVYVFVELNESVDNKDVVWSKIKHGLKDFKMQLPGGVLAVMVIDDFGNTVSMLIGLESEDKTPRELREYADELMIKLYTIPEMGKVKLVGEQKEEIVVHVQPERLASYGLSPNSIFAELYLQGFSTLTGTLDTDDLDLPLHVERPFNSEREIAELIVYSDASGNVLHLKDIATIERKYPENESYVSINDHNTVLMSLEMKPGNDIVAFGGEVNEILADFEQTLPESVNMQLITNQPKVVGDSVTSFLRDLVVSILIVIAVMLLLFPLNSALVAGVGIPICTMISIGLMYLVGIELNTVSLAALIMVLGMICDNSIVMIDGYTSYLNRGYSRMYSALTSAKEFFPPLVLATVAICGMFFPVTAIMTGIMHDFIQLFPWAVTFSLGVSLAFAVLVVPYLEVRFIRPTKGDGQKLNLFERGQMKFFAVLQKGYDKLLGFCFKHYALTLSIGVLFMAAGVWMFTKLPVQMLPKADRESFAIEISLPEGSSLAATKEVADSLQHMLSGDERITSMTVFVGQSSPRFHATYAPNMPGKNRAQFIVNTQSVEATNTVLKQYTDSLAEYFPSAHVRFKQMDYQAVTNPIEVYVKGDDLDDIKEVSDELMAYMRTLDDVAWVHSNTDGYVPGINIKLKTDEATRLGVTKANLSLSLASTLGGQSLGTLWEDDYSIPVRLKTTDATDSLTCEDIENIVIPTALPGVWVPVRQVAEVTPDYRPARIAHRNGERCTTVGCDLKYGKGQTAAMGQIEEYIENELEPKLPEGVSISYGGLTGANEHIIPELIAAVSAAVLVIFLFLIFNFGKISISVISLLSTLLCFFGAFGGLYLFGLDFGITCVLGIVSLIGIIVRNGIIMFEYAEQLRSQYKYPTREAAFLAGTRRMRPIFLTSATTAIGVVPMIMAGTGLWMPMGVVICFGTALALIFIVTVLPVAYWKIYETKKERIAYKNSLKK